MSQFLAAVFERCTWHPNADEWSYFISGRARVTVFASSNSARTFNYMAGDVGIVPKSMDISWRI